MYDKIVSLSPSFSTTLDAIGWNDKVVGVTEHDKASNVNGRGIESVGGWLSPDYKRINKIEPDIVLTTGQLQRQVYDELKDEYNVFHREPETIKQTKNTIQELGKEIGAEDETRKLLSEMESRFDEVSNYVEDKTRPVVYCEEWDSPPMVAGNWVPDVVNKAGGQYPFVESGERSREISKGEVRAAEPDLFIIHHCGQGKEPSPEIIEERWGLDIETIVMDDSLLNQPSPNLVFAVEKIADLLHNYEVKTDVKYLGPSD